MYFLKPSTNISIYAVNFVNGRFIVSEFLTNTKWLFDSTVTTSPKIFTSCLRVYSFSRYRLKYETLCGYWILAFHIQSQDSVWETGFRINRIESRCLVEPRIRLEISNIINYMFSYITLFETVEIGFHWHIVKKSSR